MPGNSPRVSPAGASPATTTAATPYDGSITGREVSMRFDTPQLFVFLAIAVAAIVAGLWLSRRAQRAPAMLLVTLGFGAIAALAAWHLKGGFGPELLWFRAPTFYVAAALLLAGAIGWFVRPIAGPRARLIRFGVPAAAIGLLGLVAIYLRVDGHSMPLAMLMPTRDAPAPDLTWFDASGRVHRLADLRGKVVLVNFWATWCAPCRKEMPLLSRMQREHEQDGLVVVYISLEEPQVLDAFLARNSFEGVKGRLDRAAEFYDAGKFYPLSYLIARDGRVAERWSGRPDERWLAATIQAALVTPARG